MSTNIHFFGTRKIKVISTGRVSTQQIVFDAVYQTPTRVTWDIMNTEPSVRPITYKEWVLRECSIDEELDVFAEDDIWCEREPIGKQIYNEGKEHIKKFDAWLKMCEEEGFEVQTEAY